MAEKKAARKTFEERMDCVQQILARMESGTAPLEQLLKDYEQGTAVLNEMEKELTEARQRLTVLRRQSDGELAEESLED